MPKKDNLGNPMQKGKRRQKLHRDQNNVGDPKKPSGYTDFEGNIIE